MTDRKPKAMMVSTGVQVDMEKVESSGSVFMQTISTPPLRLQPLTTPPAVMSLNFMSKDRFSFPVSHTLEVDYIPHSSAYGFPTIEQVASQKIMDIELDPYCKAEEGGPEFGQPDLPVEQAPALPLPKNKKGMGKRATSQKQDSKLSDETQTAAAHIAKSPHEWSVSPKEGVSLGKAGSEMPTDTSISPTYRELSELPGLAGRPAFFKYSKCSDCRVNRTSLVFWLGDAYGQNSSRTFTCMKCLIANHGQPKILEHFFHTEHSDPTGRFRELLELDKSHIKHIEGQDEDTAALNEALEAKVVELTFLATKMSRCFDLVKARCDKDSRLLAYKMLNETIELVWKAKLILRASSFSRKLEFMTKAEAQYFKNNMPASKAAVSVGQQLLIVEPVTYGRKSSESDLMQLFLTTKSEVPSKKHSFNIDFSEDRSCLQKREVRSKTLFDEIEDEIEPVVSKPGLLAGKLEHGGLVEPEQLPASIL